MDISKLIGHAILLVAVYLSVEVECGKKYHGHKYQIKPLFGVGVGYKKVVSYKPVIVFQKHKHIKLKRPIGWGWGWGGWGWKPQHHGHHQRGHHGWGGGGGHGHGHKHNIENHHYHHHDGGWGGWGWGDEGDSGGQGSGVGIGGGWGWGEDHDDYGGWESNLKANWSTAAGASSSRQIPDQMPGYSEHGPSPPPPVEMLQAKVQAFRPDFNQNRKQDDNDKQQKTSSSSSEEKEADNKNTGQEIINQTPPRQEFIGGNYANFNMGHPLLLMNKQLPKLIFANSPKGQSTPISSPLQQPLPPPLAGPLPLPFYAQAFPNFQQFHKRARH